MPSATVSPGDRLEQALAKLREATAGELLENLLQAFYGALAGQKAKRGVFITTSGFTAHFDDE